MSRTIGLALLFLMAAMPAQADGLGNSARPMNVDQFIKRGDLNALQMAIMSAIPLPGTVAPTRDSGAGSPGSSIRFMREDAVRPSQRRSITVTLDANGAAAGSWSVPLVSSNPVPGPVSAKNANASAVQITCNFVAPFPTQAGYSIKCTQQTIGTTLLGGLALAPVGTEVGITAFEQSQ